MADRGTQIFASEFVAIQDKAQSLLGTGAGTRGYGQTVLSSDVFTGNAITKAQWDALRYDIINIRLHQDGVLPAIITLTDGAVIGYGASSPNTNYDTLLETAIANRFQLAGNQSAISTKGTASTSSSWSSLASCDITVTFASAAAARYFFNSGGKVRITPSITGGSATSQVNAWITFLSSVGTREFGADTDPLVNYYTLTNSFQTYYQGSLTTPYSANNFKLEAKTNVADNSAGTATILYLKATLTDNYTDSGAAFDPNPPPGDSVDGTLSLVVSEVKASGTMQPSGTFSVTSPSYSLSSISLT
jgi:hypothetical protein